MPVYSMPALGLVCSHVERDTGFPPAQCGLHTQLVHVPTESWTFLRATLPLLILSNIAAIGSTFSAGEKGGG